MRIITIARKPLAGSVAQTVLKYGTGGINIDGCRIGYISDSDKASAIPGGTPTAKIGALAGGSQDSGRQRTEFTPSEQKGRWSANLILQHQPECQEENCAEGCPVGAMSSYGVTKSNVIKTEKKPYEGESSTGFLRGVTNHQNHHDDSGYVSRFFKQVKG